MNLSHSTSTDIDIDESIPYEMHLADSNDVNFSDDNFSDASSSRYTNGEIKPRTGGPKESRMYRVRLMDTGRYCEAAIARGETIEDVDKMYTLRVNNVWMANEVEIRKEFEVYGRLGDVYRPINKDKKMKPADFFFVRFMEYDDMITAQKELQGKVLHGRPMKIDVAFTKYELSTSIF